MTSFFKTNNSRLFSNALALIALSFGLAWLSSDYSEVLGWPSFFVLSIICGALVFLVWRNIRGEDPPKWLLALILGAILLRLVLGVLWFVTLPEIGYETPVQQAGYVMEDAFNRDAAAWNLAQSESSLWQAFEGYSVRDQYGGLLFLSAAVYRYLGAAEHQPLLILMLSATISGLAVAYTWAFSNRLWGSKSAQFAAWGLALYPEAVLLGSSQMREAYSVSLVMLALYALLTFQKKPSNATAALLVFPLILAIPLSNPFAISLLVLVGLASLVLYNRVFFKQRKYWIPALAILFIALIYYLIRPDTNGLWIVQSAEWQAYISRNASGWVARQFNRMPPWGQIPFLLIYGVFRPLLPAAIFADGLPIWRIIAVWRALGWTFILAMLFYASYWAIRQKALWKIPGVLLASNWGLILIASYRGGGDLWDSPRYRSTFAGMQLALAAWALVQQGESRDPWMKRTIVGAGWMIFWFAPWYLRRYANFEWPIVELQHVIGLGLASALLYVIWDWSSA